MAERTDVAAREAENIWLRRTIAGVPVPAGFIVSEFCYWFLIVQGGLPSDAAGGGTELAIGGYHRANVAHNVATFGPLGTIGANQIPFDFGTPVADGPNIEAAGFSNASGVLVAWKPLNSLLQVRQNVPLIFAPGSITWQED